MGQKLNTSRLILSRLRKGDYTHAGDKEAIDLVLCRALELSSEIVQGPCLDVGSGLGGTAQVFCERGFQKIYGIDLDEAAVSHAQKNYPQIQFSVLNALSASDFFPKEMFSFIYLFNVLYAIEDKKAVLEQLTRIAKPGSLLAIFDYTSKKSVSLIDFAGKPIHPMDLNMLQRDLKLFGWDVLDVVDLSSHYVAWYQNLLTKLSKKRSDLLLEFSKEEIDLVEEGLNLLLQLGGAMIFARKKL